MGSRPGDDTERDDASGSGSHPDHDGENSHSEREDIEPHETEYPGMDPEGFAEPAEKTVKPLTPEALAAFNAAQAKTGVIYISRIPPGMRPTKVRHLMSQYGEVGRVYLQQEDPKRAYLRRKHTSTKKVHYTEGWVEFKDKRVARSVADILNAQPIGGKKGTRWRDDVWTMKYLPKFKWNMLTEQIAHEAAIHTARLRVELTQSKAEQQDYLKNVELARVLDKRAERKRKAAEERGEEPEPMKKKPHTLPRRDGESESKRRKKTKAKPDGSDDSGDPRLIQSVLGSIF